MKWSVNELFKLQEKGLVIDESYELNELVSSHPDLRKISPIHVKGKADISSLKVTFHLTLTGVMTLPCARTLVDVEYPFTIQTVETFLLKPSDYEIEDENTHSIQGDVVDLSPVIRELVLLEVPLQVFSEHAAPQEGNDWKIVSEEEQKNKIDPRLAGLAKFFEQDDNRS
ncbi:YceD family protein [Bacillus sp. FJAT-47783]|uniref:YceD family protein n=1 Tax=Bacillus sp. FJAT-47783 TaxID=2922712 RepID=UPI001FABAEAF|nr:YceD family protein [Bacillus sp. FJAT-47783]